MRKRARKGETVEEWLHRVVIRNPEITVDELAEELGTRPNDLYEWCNINQERSFPLRLLLPLMRVTGDTSVLQHLSAQVGLVAYRIRKRNKSGIETAEDIQEYMRRFAEVLITIIEAFKNQNRIDKQATLKELDDFMSSLAGLRDDIDNLSDQMDLGLEE